MKVCVLFSLSILASIIALCKGDAEDLMCRGIDPTSSSISPEWVRIDCSQFDDSFAASSGEAGVLFYGQDDCSLTFSKMFSGDEVYIWQNRVYGVVIQTINNGVPQSEWFETNESDAQVVYGVCVNRHFNGNLYIPAGGLICQGESFKKDRSPSEFWQQKCSSCAASCFNICDRFNAPNTFKLGSCF